MLFEMTGIVKRFGGLVALDRVDFAVREGEVMALVGDNGAGKSTLIKTMSGAYIPDAGEIRMAGQPVRFRSPQDAWQRRHRDDLSGTGAGREDDRRRQHLPRAGDPAARPRHPLPRPSRDAPAHGGAAEPARRPRSQPRQLGGNHVRRPAPGHRHRPRAQHGRRPDHHGRTDGGAGRGGSPQGAGFRASGCAARASRSS